jgi:hypothetical protein
LLRFQRRGPFHTRNLLGHPGRTATRCLVPYTGLSTAGTKDRTGLAIHLSTLAEAALH